MEERETPRPSAPVVTISATYGSGGGVIGPMVAAALEVPFLDRAIPAAVARSLAVSFETAVAHESPQTRLSRFVASFARLPESVSSAAVPMGPEHDLGNESAYKKQTESVISDVTRTTGGVILGRAGVIVLRSLAGVLHVRLDGPVEERVLQAARLEGIGESEARVRQRETDRAREAYMRRLYRSDPSDCSFYHMVMNTTALPIDVCADLVVRAARSL